MNQIIDHGDFDFLTPNPSETDKAIARAIRNQFRADVSRFPQSVQQQLARNGLSPSADPFAWLVENAVEYHMASLNGDKETQTVNLADDLRMYGTAFSIDGKRIDPRDVYLNDEDARREGRHD